MLIGSSAHQHGQSHVSQYALAGCYGFAAVEERGFQRPASVVSESPRGATVSC